MAVVLRASGRPGRPRCEGVHGGPITSNHGSSWRRLNDYRHEWTKNARRALWRAQAESGSGSGEAIICPIVTRALARARHERLTGLASFPFSLGFGTRRELALRRRRQGLAGTVRGAVRTRMRATAAGAGRAGSRTSGPSTARTCRRSRSHWLLPLPFEREYRGLKTPLPLRAITMLTPTCATATAVVGSSRSRATSLRSPCIRPSTWATG